MAKQTLSIIEIKNRSDLHFPSLIDFFQASIEYTKMRELVMHYQHKLALVRFGIIGQGKIVNRLIYRSQTRSVHQKRFLSF